MKISVGFMKIHRRVYKISTLTFLPLEAQIFITKTKKVLKIIITEATLKSKICILMVLGQEINIYFSQKSENKKNPSN